jgi:hypothetical protein
VYKFDATGALVDTWGVKGSGQGEFSYPSGIAVDAAGTVYVADTFNHRIQQFDNAGNFMSEWGSEGNGDGAFNLPFGVATDSSDTIYVADTFNNRIQIFDFSDKPCMVTSIFGETDVYTKKMRDFRDRFLAQHAPGRRLINFYVRTSALTEPLFEKSPLARKTARIMLKSLTSVIDLVIP